MTNTFNVSIGIQNANERTLCEQLIAGVWDDLARQGRSKAEKGEFGKLLLSDEFRSEENSDSAVLEFVGPAIENADLLITSPTFARAGQYKREQQQAVPTIILLPKDDTWTENINSILMNPNCDVRGVFRHAKLDRNSRDPEDYGAFVTVVKKIVRSYLARRDAQEEHFAKSIRWKARVATKLDMSYVSLFSDPATQNMAHDFKSALTSLDRPELEKWNDLFQQNELKEEFNKHKQDFCIERSKITDVTRYRSPSLLLLGETGCGKSLLASIVARKLRKDKMERLNIAAAVKENVNVLLFGAIEGAYTGCKTKQPGIFIGNVGGVVFLDEIGDMDESCQTRLLTYMDDGRVLPMGESESVLAPCILVAATNKNIDDPSSGFRQDIVHRFDHIIRIPPLRARKEDLRLLISLTLQDKEVNPFEKDNKGEDTQEHRVEKISLDSVRFLEDYDYPGNFRELRFILRQAVNNAYADHSKCICVRHVAPVLMRRAGR